MTEWLMALGCGAEDYGFTSPSGQPGIDKLLQTSSKILNITQQELKNSVNLLCLSFPH